MNQSQATPRRLPFRSVNHRRANDYDSALQRHHLLPRQLLHQRCFFHLFDALGMNGRAFDDFRLNGLLLPTLDSAAMRMGLPLHRGPHRRYNAVVLERVGRIEAGWAAQRPRGPDRARDQALMRLGLLQRALRLRLLSAARPFPLNSKDPLGSGVDYSDLDAMAHALWSDTGEGGRP